MSTGSGDLTTECQQALNEVNVMLRYALAKGLALDDKTQATIATFKSCEPGESATPNFTTILAAHTALAKIVAPATPRSLEATEPLKGTLGSLLRPVLIPWVIGLALIAAIVFIATIVRSPSRTNPTGTDQTKPVALKLIPAALSGQANGASLQPAAGAETTRTDPNDTSRQVSALEALNWCCAAALGAAFYVLFQAQEYVTKRTFDPQYNSVYVIRLVLGILAGFILAYVTQSTGLLKGQLKDYGPPVIALLGGFSTDAVNQVLQRLVEIVMAAIRGDGSQAAKTKANQTAQSELLSLAGDPSVASNQPVLNKIHAAVTKLSQ